jgi:hypothetical protein
MMNQPILIIRKLFLLTIVKTLTRLRIRQITFFPRARTPCTKRFVSDGDSGSEMVFLDPFEDERGTGFRVDVVEDPDGGTGNVVEGREEVEVELGVVLVGLREGFAREGWTMV